MARVASQGFGQAFAVVGHAARRFLDDALEDARLSGRDAAGGENLANGERAVAEQARQRGGEANRFGLRTIDRWNDSLVKPAVRFTNPVSASSRQSFFMPVPKAARRSDETAVVRLLSKVNQRQP